MALPTSGWIFSLRVSPPYLSLPVSRFFFHLSSRLSFFSSFFFLFSSFFFLFASVFSLSPCFSRLREFYRTLSCVRSCTLLLSILCNASWRHVPTSFRGAPCPTLSPDAETASEDRDRYRVDALLCISRLLFPCTANANVIPRYFRVFPRYFNHLRRKSETFAPLDENDSSSGRRIRRLVSLIFNEIDAKSSHP